LTSPTIPLPAGFSVTERIDEDPVAVVYLIGDGAGGAAVLTVARNPVAADERAAYRRWAGAVLGVADGASAARVLAADVTPDGRPFLVTETGTALGDLLDDGALPVAAGAACGRVLADALARSHAAGIPHGAVQPATVLVEGDRTVLAGFGGVAPGLAVASTADAYTPPELLSDALVGRSVATQDGDVYQLGVTLYVALGGALPWEGAPLDLFARTTPLAETPAVRGELLELLRAMTLPDPVARPTAAQVRDWLAGFEPEGDRDDRAIPRELLAGRGVRKVGRRAAALASIAGGAAGVAAGVLAALPATPATAVGTPGAAVGTGTTGTALPTAAATGTAATGAVAAGMSVTKVVVIATASVVVGVGGAYTVTNVLGDGPCDAVVADRPLSTVVVDSVRYLETDAFSFRLRYADEVDAEGSIDPVARTATITLKPPARYVGEARLNGDDLAVSGQIAGTAPGEWVHQPASDNIVAKTVTGAPKTVATMLAVAEEIERDGCDLTGRIVAGDQQGPFRLSIEDGTGRLRRFTAGTGTRTAVDLEVTGSGPATTPPATTTSEARTGLDGRWVNDGPWELVINGATAGVTYLGTAACGGSSASTGTSADLELTCTPDISRDGTMSLHVELTGADEVTVRGPVDLVGVYRLAAD